MIALLFLVALTAPLVEKFTGISPDDQNVFARYQPLMSRVEVSDSTKEERIEEYISNKPDMAKSSIAFIRTENLIPASISDEEAMYELLLDHQVAELPEHIYQDPGIAGLIAGFSSFHLLGTDELGRDVAIRLIYGARVSIGVGILVALAAALIGLLVGSLAGYYGGFIDAILSRVIDALLSLPLLPLLIVFSAVDLDKIPVVGELLGGENESVLKLVCILVIFSWMTVARLVRGSILSVKEQEYILAARTLGASDLRIITSHVIPNVVAPLLVAVTLNVGNSILMEAALSFLGLGIQPPMPSWGNMLTNAQELIFDAPQLAFLPGFMILITVICFNFIGDGLRDAIDPKTIKR